MQVDLEELQPRLKEATVATDALLIQIAKDTEVANEKKAIVEEEASADLRFPTPCTLRIYKMIVVSRVNFISHLSGSHL